MFPFSDKKGKFQDHLGPLDRAIRYHCNLYHCTGFVKILVTCFFKEKNGCFPRARQYIPREIK